VAQGQTAAGGARHLGSGAARLVRVWRALPHEQRLAAYAALGLFLTMFLPWYQRNFFTVIGGKLLPAADSQTAWAAFSWVEAAVLLVAGGVLTLLFNRAEGRAFHVPGGDGGVIAVAGLWTGLLIIWRIFDKQGGSSRGQYATTYGIEWGIFIALAVAAFLVYAGNRIRAAHILEPPLPGEEQPAGRVREPVRVRDQRARGEQRAPVEQRAGAEKRAAGAEKRAAVEQQTGAPRPVPAPAGPESPTLPAGGAPTPAAPAREVPPPRRRAPTRSNAPTWDSAPPEAGDSAPTRVRESDPAHAPDQAPTRVSESGGAHAPDQAPTRVSESGGAHAPDQAPTRVSRPRRPLHPDEQLTMPLDERDEQ
jgi:hypothetical protein